MWQNVQMTQAKDVKTFKALSVKLPWRLMGGRYWGKVLKIVSFFVMLLFNYVLTPVQWHQMMDGFIKGLVWNKVLLVQLISSSFYSSGGEKMWLLYRDLSPFLAQ